MRGGGEKYPLDFVLNSNKTLSFKSKFTTNYPSPLFSDLPTSLLNKTLWVFFFRLGLATAPVLFAADEREELDSLINRRFSHEGKLGTIVELLTSL